MILNTTNILKSILFLYRCLAQTELQTQGPESSNQLSRLEGLLKGKPQKLSLRRKGISLRNIPPLNVVFNPSVDTDARQEGIIPRPEGETEDVTNRGFKPGPFLDHAWILERNKIPAVDYEHEKFNRLKGHDFK